MKSILKILLFISMISTVSFAKDLDINKLVEEAKVQKKDLMFFFHIPECPYCERMLKKNFKDKEVLSEIKKSFVFVDIYTASQTPVVYKDFKGTQKEFAKFMNIKTYPTTLFTDTNLKVLYSSLGYRNIIEYMYEIQYVSTDSYKTKDLQTFADDLEFEKDD